MINTQINTLLAVTTPNGEATKALGSIHTILTTDIVKREMTAAELDAMVRSFLVENPIDDLGTFSAIVTYAMAISIITDKSSGDLAENALFNTVTNIGLTASFFCGLSFTSSSYDNVQDYRRAHLRTKNNINNDIFMRLMLEVIQHNTDAPEKMNFMLRLAEAELRVLQQAKGRNELMLSSSAVRRYPPDEIERVLEEKRMLQIQYAEKKIDTIKALQQNPTKRKPQSIIQDIRLQQRRILDILKRPQQNADVDYSSGEETQKDYDNHMLPSTSLYAKRRELIEHLAAYQMIVNETPTANKENDTESLISDAMGQDHPSVAATFSPIALAALAAKHPEIAKAAALYFDKSKQIYLRNIKKIYDNTTALKANASKIGQATATEQNHQIKATYFRLLQDFRHVQSQIDSYRASLSALEEMEAALDTKITKKYAFENQIPLENASAETRPTKAAPGKRVTFLKPIDTRTTFLWQNEGREFWNFLTTIWFGLGEGIASLTKTDDLLEELHGSRQSAWYGRILAIDYYAKHGLNKIKNIPVLWHIMTGLYVFLNIPYFLFYAFSNFSNLLDNLKKVIDALHKSAKDVDQSLRHHSKDNGLLIPFKYVLRLAWMAITIIPETLGGMFYFFLSLLRKDGTVVDIANAITPPTWAKWIAQENRTASKSYKFVLHIITFIGGIVNTIWSPLKKIVSIFEITRNDNDIQASRDALYAGIELLVTKVKAGFYNLIEEPFVSAWTQIKEEEERLSAMKPFRSSPIAWMFNHVIRLPLQYFLTILLNVVLRSICLFIKNLLTAAPVITASVITISTLMTGIPFPVNLLLTLEFSKSTQLWFAIAATAGDATNGTHDVYNLSNAILRNQQKIKAEKKALEKMGEDTDTAKFSRLKTVFERVEEGASIVENINNKKIENEKDEYKRWHLSAVKSTVTSTDTLDDKTLDVLARHLAYFLVNTAAKKTLIEYNELYASFKLNEDVREMANKIIESIPVDAALSPDDKMHYIVSTTTLLGYDYAKQLNELRFNHYHEDAIYLYVGGVERSNRLKFIQNPENQNEYISKKNDQTFVATKISFFRSPLLWIISSFFDIPNVINGYRITSTGSDAAPHVNNLEKRGTTSLYLVNKDPKVAPIRGKRAQGTLVNGESFEFSVNGNNVTAREKWTLESVDSKQVFGEHVVNGLQSNASDWQLQWLNPKNKVNVNKAARQLSDHVEQDTKSLSFRRGC